MNLFDLTGQVAFVTGGGRGLGKSIALGLAKAGADIALMSRTEKELKQTAKEIEELGRKAYYGVADVRDKKAITKVVEEVVNQAGKIDILVNAAGTNRRFDFLSLSEEDWDFVMDVNLKSVFLTSQVVIPYMQKAQYGRIINIGSLTSELGFINMPAYAASKGAVKQLTKVLSVEFAEDGILCNAIGPGYFETDMTKVLFEDQKRVEWMKSRTPLGRTGKPEELQGMAVYLASPAASFTTGQMFYVDGGWLGS